MDRRSRGNQGLRIDAVNIFNGEIIYRNIIHVE